MFLKNKKKILNLDNNLISKNKFWINIYNKIKDIINNNSNNLFNIKLSIKNKKIFELTKSDNYINNLLKKSIFISPSIINYIKSNFKKYYLIEYDNNLIYYFIENSVKKSIKTIKSIKTKEIKINKDIYHICSIIHSIKILFDRTNKNNKQTLYYFPTPLKKKINKDTKILGINECNTGYSHLEALYEKKDKIQCCHSNGNIYIFRKEEHYKVLIHELIHSCYRDRDMILSEENDVFSNKFCVNKKILLNESYTETIATILNLFYVNIISKKDIKNLDLIFQNETKYSFYTMIKILNFYKINSINDFIKNNKNKKECNTKFLQSTNVFSYYIVKPLLLSNLKLFTSYLDKYTDNFSIKSSESVKYFSNIILKIINKKDTKNIIKKLLIGLKNNKNKSLRLTLYEIK
jgi:hypothetical protein